jgi:gliding motility-associated-like protein
VGDLIQLNANATPASSVFTWNGPGGFTSNSQNPFIPSNSTLYSGTFTVTATFGGCTSTSLDTITITIHPTPVAVASANWSSSNCSAGTNTLSGNGGVSYNWSGPGGFSSNAQNPVVTSSGIYTLVATNSYGCSNSDTTSITIIPTPTVSGVTSVNGSNACVGDVIQLNANATPASSVFTWNGPGGFTSNSQNPFVPSNSTLYSGTFTVTATFGGCTSTSLDTITITIHANPVAVASANWASVNCSTTTNTLSGSGGVSYSWNGPGGFGSVQQNPIVTLSGMYTLTVTDQNGCKSTDTTQITITQTPAPALVANAQTCKGSPLVLTATGSAGVITWYTDAGLTTQVATGTTYAPTLASGTSAIYYVTVNNNGCVSATQTVSAANYNVQVTASADPTSGQAPLVVNFSAAVTGSVNPLFSWNFASGNSNSSLQNPAFTYAAAGEYASVVTVTDAASGCVASDTLIIYVEDDVVLVIPNIFTPNGDGINDNFFITSTGVQRVEGSILDRWGETMFAWTGINSFWDGKAQTGMPVPDGTYFFVFKATLLNNETRTYKGTVTLLR